MESIVSLKKKLKVGCKVYVVDDASNYDYSEFEKVFKGDDFILEILEINQDPGPERNRGLEDSNPVIPLISLKHLLIFITTLPQKLSVVTNLGRFWCTISKRWFKDDEWYVRFF